jgi:hypothetical protein
MPPEMTGMAVNGGANMAGDGRGDIAGARYTNESRGEIERDREAWAGWG